MSDTLKKLFELLHTSPNVPPQVSDRYSAITEPDVQSHDVLQSTTEAQIEHMRVRVGIDAGTRREGIESGEVVPIMLVGFGQVLSNLLEIQSQPIETHVVKIQDGTLLLYTSVGTTRLIAVLWPFEHGLDPFP